MANSTDPEKVAQEEVYPELINGWKFPGEWANEGLHSRLLKIAEARIAERGKKTGDEDKPVEEAKKRATGRRPSTSSAEGPAPAVETEDVE